LTKRLDAGQGETKTGTFVGTTDYIAPEQVMGAPIDARTDIYSLGCMFFELLTGRVPYPAQADTAKLVAHAYQPPPSLSEAAADLPAGLDQVVRTAMAKNPADRQQSAQEFGHAALAAASGAGPAVPSAKWPPPVPAPPVPAPPVPAPPPAWPPPTPAPQPPRVALAQSGPEAHRPLHWAWTLVPVLSLGFLSFVPFFYMGARAKYRRWHVLGAAYLAAAVGEGVLAALTPHGSGGAGNGLLGALVILLMGGAAGNVIALRKSFGQRLSAVNAPELVAAEQRAIVKSQARSIARSDPVRARELGIGRPDLPNAFDGGLIDINHAPATVIASRLGVDEATAAQIVEVRSLGSGFSSVEDLDLAFNLRPAVIAEIRNTAVFLPI
jgi:DNA uptake protein ComE-like DNA-binding protein